MIPTWQQRLDALDHSKGTSNTMRENCMKAEIKALRTALRRTGLPVGCNFSGAKSAGRARRPRRLAGTCS